MPDIITEPQAENGNVLKYRLGVLERDFDELKKRYENRHDALAKEFEEKLETQNKIIFTQSNEITALKERLTAAQLFQTGFASVAGIVAIVISKLIGS